MSNQVSIKGSSSLVTGVCGAMAVLGLMVGIKTEHPTAKVLAWSISLSGLLAGGVNIAASRIYEETANAQIEAIVKRKKSLFEAANRKIKELEAIVDQSMEVDAKRQQNLHELECLLHQKQTEIGRLESEAKNMAALVQQLRDEITRLGDHQFDEWYKVEQALESLVTKSRQILEQHLNTVYPRLLKAIESSISKQLEKEKRQAEANSSQGVELRESSISRALAKVFCVIIICLTFATA